MKKDPIKKIFQKNRVTFRFLHVCHVEKCKIPPNLAKFHISPHLLFGKTKIPIHVEKFHVLKSEISPHGRFFLHLHVGDWGDKYQVWVDRLNVLLHCVHLWLFSPLWMSRWVFRSPAWLNYLLQSAHLCDFASLWMSLKMHLYPIAVHCVSASESSDVQQVWMFCCIQHICVTSPRCEWAYWVFRFTAWLICCILLQINIWLASWLEYLNDLTHMLQGCGFAMSKIWSVLLLLFALYDLSVHFYFPGSSHSCIIFPDFHLQFWAKKLTI